MVILSRTILALVLIPLLLFALEFLLAVKAFRAALILPAVVMCLTFWLGGFALMLGGVMYCICGMVWLIRREKKTERERMDIQDL